MAAISRATRCPVIEAEADQEDQAADFLSRETGGGDERGVLVLAGRLPRGHLDAETRQRFTVRGGHRAAAAASGAPRRGYAPVSSAAISQKGKSSAKPGCGSVYGQVCLFGELAPGTPSPSVSKRAVERMTPRSRTMNLAHGVLDHERLTGLDGHELVCSR